MKYQMSDGTIVNTNNATASYGEERDHDGRNFIGRSSGSQWLDEQLYRSRKGRYYIVTESRMQGTSDRAEWVSNEEATRWLLLNDKEVPAELEKLVAEVSE